MKGKERERAPGGGRKPEPGTAGDRPFFILFYLKAYPLRQVTAVLFGMKPESDRYSDSQAFGGSEKGSPGGSYLICIKLRILVIPEPPETGIPSLACRPAGDNKISMLCS